jgi:hypothetical protein
LLSCGLVKPPAFLPPLSQVEHLYTTVRKTHNAGVFDAYTDEMRAARKSGILTGLPDGYGRGRIIGDYRCGAVAGARSMAAARSLTVRRTAPKHAQLSGRLHSAGCFAPSAGLLALGMVCELHLWLFVVVCGCLW